MTREELRTIAKKHQQGVSSEQENHLLNTFISKVQKINSTGSANPTIKNKKHIIRGVEQQIGHKFKRPSFHTSRWLAFAAIFIGLIAITVLLQNTFSTDYTTQRTAKGQKLTLRLADGSRVFLNGNSSITYSDDFESNRNIKLKGEAFFEVYRDEEHPFTITTGAITTQVLGTTFNINNYDEQDIVVSVNSGKVYVKNTNTKDSVFLTQNQQVNFKGNEIPVKSRADSEDHIAWTRNVISLKNTTLAKTAAILENWYDVTIEFENHAIEELKITGKFKNESLQNVLKSIALINNLKIDTLTQKHIRIRENPEYK